MRRMTAVILMVILSLVVGLVGCSTFSGRTTTTPEELVQRAQEATGDLRTCRMEVDMAISLSGAQSGSISMGWTGSFDVASQKMEMLGDINMVMPMYGEEEIQGTMQYYLVDGYIYTKMSYSGLYESPWIKAQVPDFYTGMEAAGTPYPDLEGLADLLASASEVSIEGSAVIGGVDCYYIKVQPDMVRLWEMMMGDLGEDSDLGLNMKVEDAEDIAQMMQTFTVEIWYAKDTYLPMKMSVEVNMIDPADSQNKMDFSVDFVMYDYNEDVGIALPPAASSATEYNWEAWGNL